MAEVGVKKDNSVIIVFAINEATGIFETTDNYNNIPLVHIKYPLLSRFTKGFEHDYKKVYDKNKFTEYDSVSVRVGKLSQTERSSRHKMEGENASMKKYQKMLKNTMTDVLETSKKNNNVNLFAFEFAYNRLDPHTFHADARTDAVNIIAA